MNKQQVVDAVALYERRIGKEGVTEPVQMDGNKHFGDLNREELLAHALYLCGNVRTFAHGSHTHRDKMMRHLGSVQTLVSLLGLFTLNELRSHNQQPAGRESS